MPVACSLWLGGICGEGLVGTDESWLAPRLQRCARAGTRSLCGPLSTTEGLWASQPVRGFVGRAPSLLPLDDVKGGAQTPGAILHRGEAFRLAQHLEDLQFACFALLFLCVP